MREAIGRNGPRIFSGASGFRSKVSSWLGPPNRKRKITDLARARGAVGVRPGLGGEQPGETHAEQAGPGRLEQRAPRDPVTGPSWKSFDAEHARPLRRGIPEARSLDRPSRTRERSVRGLFPRDHTVERCASVADRPGTDRPAGVARPVRSARSSGSAARPGRLAWGMRRRPSREGHGLIDQRTPEACSRLDANLYACHPRLVNEYLGSRIDDDVPNRAEDVDRDAHSAHRSSN